MIIEAGYQCASCGEAVDTVVDASAGYHQRYTEDCVVCCRPNLLVIEVDPSDGVAYVTASFEE